MLCSILCHLNNIISGMLNVVKTGFFNFNDYII